MKKEHKTMSVVAALVLLLLIGYAYNHSKKEGMASASAKNTRNSQPKPSGVYKPQTNFEHVIHFLSMVWIVDFFKKLFGGATPKGAAADANKVQARVLRNANQNRRAAIKRIKEMSKQASNSPTAAGAAAARAAAGAGGAAGPVGAGAAGVSGSAAGVEGFANRGRSQGRGAWRPPGSVAPM